ncbi:MAG TPA: hypothetical protein VJB14_04750 [Planctomycetota bacterium]|nr:hypothetical protein [Planctomycetota bacterium]
MRALSLLLLAGCAVASAPARETAQPPDPTRAEWRLHLDTRDRGIGAYTITIRSNPEVAVIEEIAPCSPKYFKGTPEYDPASFKTGVTRITALDVFGSRPRSGEWHLFTVIFRKTGPGTLTARAQLEKLYDDENKPFSGRLMDVDFTHPFP